MKIYIRIDKIRNSVSSNLVSNEKNERSITASFGVGFYPNDGKTLETVINCADRFLYKAKHAGKNKVMSSHFFR
ncbi:diguanylate cyclase [Clostridium sp.]|uniref:GGDEF domain-containing protein n=1 Tax=Clostridium sp. TaxID=1506 RepID=UPI002911A159|nr:diguanylate cyclase [Clostridium sp.]MDU3526620.1 diguanylate cyclase [Clostridium sp.]